MFRRILIGAVKSYQLLISSWTPPTCRFYPSCSTYAIEAISEHGGLRGAWLAVRRIARCHPWGGHGYDPVPCAHAERRMDDVRGEDRALVADNMRNVEMPTS